MADTQHTLEVEIRTKDFASASLKRVGEEGKAAGDTITRSMGSATSGVQGFAKEWLTLDGGFKKVATAGIGAMSSINAAITTATASGDDLGKTMMSTATSIAAGFASGGMVGGAIAAASAGIGLLINAFNDLDTAAVAAGNNAAEAVGKLSGQAAAGFNAARKGWNELQAEIEIAQVKLLGRPIDEGLLRVQAKTKDLLAANSALVSELRAKYDALQSSVNALATSTSDEGKAAYEQQKAALELAGRALYQAQREADIIAKNAEAEARLIGLRERLQAKEKEASAKAAEQRDADAKGKAYRDQLRTLSEQVNEVIRRSKLNAEDLAVDELRRLAQSALLAGLKEEAAILFDLEKRRREEYREKNKAHDDTKKALDEQTQKAEKYDKVRKDTLKTEKDMSDAIRAGKPSAKEEGAAAEKPDLFPEGSLAEQRQLRRDTLRARKRARAALGRRRIFGGRIPGMRSGRRAGGLGAFSELFTPVPGVGGGAGAGAGVDEGGTAGVAGVQGFGQDGVQLALPPGAPAAGAAGRGAPAITSAGMASTAEAAAKQAEALKSLEEQIRRMKESADAGKAAAEGASSNGQAVSAALESVNGSIGQLAEAMAGAATNAQSFGDKLSQVLVDVQRLKEAMKLRGGN